MPPLVVYLCLTENPFLASSSLIRFRYWEIEIIRLFRAIQLIP